MTCTVTGTLASPAGVALPLAAVVLEPLPRAVEPRDAQVRVPLRVSATSAADGTISLALLPGTYTLRITGADGERYPTATLTVPDLETADLADLIGTASLPPAAWQASLAQAQAWATGTEPGGAGTKSAREWAELAAEGAGGTAATATQAELRDATSAVNTANKFAGRTRFDTTNERPVWATGSAAVDPWVWSDGTTAHTPAGAIDPPAIVVDSDPVLGDLTDGDQIGDAFTAGSYSGGTGTITVARQMRVDGGSWQTYSATQAVAEGEVWQVRETATDEASTSVTRDTAEVTVVLPALNPERAIPLNYLESGASHTNATMPAYVDLQAEYFGTAGDVTTNYSVINGSTWSFRWGATSGFQGVNAKTSVEAGTPDVLVICDISNATAGADLYTNGGNWRDACETNDVEMFVWSLQRVDGLGLDGYADPLEVPDSVWEAVRDQLLERETFWRGVTQSLRDTSSDPLATPIRHIPWAGILARIITEWLDGNAPSDIRPEKFLGDVRTGADWWDNHPSALGRWCIAMSRIAVVWRRNPSALPTPATLGADVTGLNAVLAGVSLSSYQWLGGIVWDVCTAEPLAEVRAWNNTPDFIVNSPANGEVKFYRSPDLDPADLPVSFDAALRLEGDTGDGDVQTGLSSVPVTWTGLATGAYQARRHPSGLWSPAVQVQRVVPEVITTVATVPLYNGAPGVSGPDGSSWMTYTDLPAGTQVGDIALWILGQRSTTQGALFDTSITTPFADRFYGAAAGSSGNNWQVGVAAGTVASLTGTFKFSRFINGGNDFLGALVILRGADLDTLALSTLDEAIVAGGNAYVEAPALTAAADSSIEYLLASGQQNAGGIGFAGLSGYTSLASINNNLTQRHLLRRLVDGGAQPRPLILFPGTTDGGPLRAFRMSIGPA